MIFDFQFIRTRAVRIYTLVVDNCIVTNPSSKSGATFGLFTAEHDRLRTALGQVGQLLAFLLRPTLIRAGMSALNPGSFLGSFDGCGRGR